MCVFVYYIFLSCFKSGLIGFRYLFGGYCVLYCNVDFEVCVVRDYW